MLKRAGQLTFIALLILTTGAWARSAKPLQTADPSGVLVVGGVIRKVGGDWRVYDNNTHGHLGVSGVVCDSDGILHLTFEQIGVQTGFGMVQPDEKLASYDVTMGISGSRNEVRIHFYRGYERGGHRKKLQCYSSIFDSAGSNLWFEWHQVMSVLI